MSDQIEQWLKEHAPTGVVYFEKAGVEIVGKPLTHTSMLSDGYKIHTLRTKQSATWLYHVEPTNPDYDESEADLKPFFRGQREGRRARHRGATYHDNPYQRENEHYSGWQRGWLSIDKAYKQGLTR